MNDRARRDELFSYAAACFSMHLQACAMGVQLHDVEAHLCEDGRTVMLCAADMEVRASFMLAETSNAADFDHRKYVEGFNEDSDQ